MAEAVGGFLSNLLFSPVRMFRAEGAANHGSGRFPHAEGNVEPLLGCLLPQYFRHFVVEHLNDRESGSGNCHMNVRSFWSAVPLP